MSTGADDRSAHDRCREDLAAYALGALDPRGATELERHLEGCEDCRAHLRWLQPAVDLLPRTVEQLPPPPGLRERLLATVRAEAGADPAQPAGYQPSRPRTWGVLLWRPATAAAAGALLVAGAVGGYLARQPGESSSVVAVRATPAARPAMAGTLAREDGAAILTMTGVPRLSNGDVYEVWVQREGAMEPASLFSPRRNRTAAAAVPGPLEGADAVLVTREPRGGSRRPTSPPLLRAPLG